MPYQRRVAAFQINTYMRKQIVTISSIGRLAIILYTIMTIDNYYHFSILTVNKIWFLTPRINNTKLYPRDAS